jgi:hypothetical protein
VPRRAGWVREALLRLKYTAPEAESTSSQTSTYPSTAPPQTYPVRDAAVPFVMCPPLPYVRTAVPAWDGEARRRCGAGAGAAGAWRRSGRGGAWARGRGEDGSGREGPGTLRRRVRYECVEDEARWGCGRRYFAKKLGRRLGGRSGRSRCCEDIDILVFPCYFSKVISS